MSHILFLWQLMPHLRLCYCIINTIRYIGLIILNKLPCREKLYVRKSSRNFYTLSSCEKMYEIYSMNPLNRLNVHPWGTCSPGSGLQTQRMNKALCIKYWLYCNFIKSIQERTHHPSLTLSVQSLLSVITYILTHCGPDMSTDVFPFKP
jgi:hypothetical protein